MLLVAAVIALVWVNSPWSSSYSDVRNWTIGTASLHLHLSPGRWAADGLLAIIFFAAGLEVKRGFVAGDLRDPRRAAIPVFAAVGGIGFTMSRLIGSLLAAIVVGGILRARNHTYRRICEAESTDADADGMLDVFDPTSGVDPDGASALHTVR